MNTNTGSPRPRSARIDAARRAQLLAAFDQSGLSAAAFAREQGLSYSTFCAWRYGRAQPKTAPPAFVQIAGAAPGAPAELVIEVGAHARICLHSQSQIALAVGLLQELNVATSC